MTSVLTDPDTASPRPEEQAERLRDQIRAIQARMRVFRGQVRQEIIRQHRDGDWCLSGSNDALDDLGLDRIQNTLTGSVTLTVEVTVNRADTHDTAASWIEAALDATSTDHDVVIEDVDIGEVNLDRQID
jgi:hypothetical protein